MIYKDMNFRKLISALLFTVAALSAFAQQTFKEEVTFEKPVTISGDLKLNKDLLIYDESGSYRGGFLFDDSYGSKRHFELRSKLSEEPFYSSFNIFLDSVVVSNTPSWKLSSLFDSPAPARQYRPMIYEATSHHFLGKGIYIDKSDNYQNVLAIDESGRVGATSLVLVSEAYSIYRNPHLSLNYNVDNLRWEMVATGSSTPMGVSKVPLYISAGETIIDGGSVTVNGTFQCKDELKVVEADIKSLRANEIKVDMNNAADYVFDENYDLKSLGEVEAYVKANKHLPGVPSAAEMKSEGMSVSEMSNLLLEKVEELTLHLIRVEKENQALKAEIEALKK